MEIFCVNLPSLAENKESKPKGHLRYESMLKAMPPDILRELVNRKLEEIKRIQEQTKKRRRRQDERTASGRDEGRSGQRGFFIGAVFRICYNLLGEGSDSPSKNSFGITATPSLGKCLIFPVISRALQYLAVS
jgi:hypothetical protein